MDDEDHLARLEKRLFALQRAVGFLLVCSRIICAGLAFLIAFDFLLDNATRGWRDAGAIAVAAVVWWIAGRDIDEL